MKFMNLLIAALLIALGTILPNNCYADEPNEPNLSGLPQILINPDFSLEPVKDNPPGWFRAMMPNITEGLKVGLSADEQGTYIFLEQKKIKGRLFNNWAQQIESPPVGQPLRLEAEVATKNAKKDGALVLVMFFDKDGKIQGAMSSEGKYKLTGSKRWRKIVLDGKVPRNCTLAIVRLGLTGPGKIMVRYAKLYLMTEEFPSAPPAIEAKSQASTAGLELLTNGSFEGDIVLGTPAGWFEAMIPDKAINLKAGVEKINGHGNVVFIQQDGVKMPLVNNWAQRLDTVPAGATLLLTADVKCQGLPENTGFVMVQCWSSDDKLLAAGTTQGSQPIGGTQDWKQVSFTLEVPEKTDVIVLRCGLANKGKIWFDNASLKIISPADSNTSGVTDSRGDGFRVTERSLKKLNDIQALSDELVKYSIDKLGPDVKIRKEIFAQSENEYQILLLFDLTD